MRLLRLSCILLVCGCFSQNGSDSQALNNDVEPCRDFRCLHWAMNRGAEPEEPAWRECSWDEVSDWLASDPDCRRQGGTRGYEMLKSEKDRWGMRSEVWFSPCFGTWASESAEGLTVICQNWTENILPIKGLPRCCKGVEVSGPFDMSNVVIADSVEYFYSKAHGISDWPQYYEAYDDLPRFNATSKLKYLSITRCSSGDDGRKRLRIPCLDMTRFSEMDNLEEVDVFVAGLAVHAEELLDNNKLRCLSVTEFYDYLVDSDEGGTGVDIGLEDDSNNEFLQHYVVDDASFDEFIKRDFSGIKKMRVEIELSQVKTWDIAYLANLHFDFLCISTENCMIAGVEAFQGGEGANALHIYMNIAKEECGRDL